MELFNFFSVLGKVMNKCKISIANFLLKHYWYYFLHISLALKR